MQLRRLRIYAAPFGSSTVFLRYAKYVTTVKFFFLSLYRLANIYAKSNLRLVENYVHLGVAVYGNYLEVVYN